MEDGMNLVMVPFHDYKKWQSEGYRTRDAHFFEQFTKNKEVGNILVVNRPVSLAEALFKGTDWKTRGEEVVLRGKGWQVTRINSKAFVLDFGSRDFVKAVIMRKKWWYLAFQDTRVQQAIKESADFLKMDDRILFLENPMAVGTIGNVGERMVVFDAIDNWLYHPQMAEIKNIVRYNYDLISQRANVILTVSQSLKSFFERKSKKVYWVPNGVEIERFRRAVVPSHPSLVVGYVGKIQERVDFGLIEKSIKAYPKTQFLIAGPVYSQRDKVVELEKKYENIEFCGDVQYKKLADFLSRIDVAIIPHRSDSFTESMNPIKVYEYLAAGKQVVSTDVSGVRGLSKYVDIASNDKDFVKKIGDALARASADVNIQKKVSKSLGAKHDWEAITESVVDIIEDNRRLDG